MTYKSLVSLLVSQDQQQKLFALVSLFFLRGREQKKVVRAESKVLLWVLKVE